MEEEDGDEGEDEVDGNICLWHQFGHCKFGPRCPDRHMVEVYSTEGCQGVCRLRHPPTCRYFLIFGRCKFGPGCSFQHSEKEKCSSEKIKVLEARIEELEAKLSLLKEKEVIEKEITSDKHLGQSTSDKHLGQPGGVEKGDEDHCPRLRDGEKVIAEPNSICVPSVTNKMSVDQVLESGVDKGDEEHCPRLRDGEKVIAQPNTICVPSVTNKMSLDHVLESILENGVFQDCVEKKVMVNTDKFEVTLDKFKKILIKIDDDVQILWDKVLGNGEEKTDIVDLTEVDGSDQRVSSNDDMVIALINTISVPSNQSGTHLDTSPSKSIENSSVKGVHLRQGDKKKCKERKVKKTVCIREE